MLHSNNQKTLSVSKTIYNILSPYHHKKNDNLDECKLIELAYEYIEANAETSRDVIELNTAFKKMPYFLENVEKWHREREEKKAFSTRKICNIFSLENEVFEDDLDECTLLELAYDYIESQELTDSDIIELDNAFKKMPKFLLNVEKWHKDREKEKLNNTHFLIQ